jgi:division protein CdvB (Snf7/Vps24/ESCRT-III family)
LGAISSIKSLGGKKDGDYKNKIAVALKDLEIQRRELEGLKGRLSERRQKLFDSTVKALQEKNNSKANIYANEHNEVRKTIKIVDASELAITQVSLRLQSIMEIGDAMIHMGTAFRSIKSVSKTMEEFVPALDATSASINNTLSETMAKMGQISPGFNVDIQNDGAEELVEQARKFAEDQAEQLKSSLNVMPSMFEAELHRSEEDHIPILASGEDGEEENIILGTVFEPSDDTKIEGEVLRYATAHNGVVDISETAVNLGIPQDEVENSMIRLVAAGKVTKSQHGSER